jgi:hypothetical protein
MRYQKDQKMLNSKKLMLYLTAFCLLTSCNFQLTDDGFLCVSENSKISKKNKTFLSYYYFKPQKIIIPNGKIYEIEEVFTERKYNRKKDGKVNFWEESQMIICFKNKIGFEYINDWSLGTSEDDISFYQGTGDFTLYGGMETVKNMDTIIVHIDLKKHLTFKHDQMFNIMLIRK